MLVRTSPSNRAHRKHRKHRVSGALLTTLLLVATGLVFTPARAQTSGLDIRITSGTTIRATGGLLTAVSVVNTGSEPLTNVQLVVRVPALPAFIQNVTEGSAPLVDSVNRAGVIDERTGLWYHTVVSIPVGVSVHFNVNWFNPCVGRWPFAARASDRRTFTSFQFSGGTLGTCGPDDVALPTPASWFDLPWPPSIVATTTTTSTTIPGGTGGVLLPTVPGATAVPGASTAPAASSVPSTVAVPTTKANATTVKPRPTTTRRPATTLEIVCKTIGGRRYCGPKSSALKPGQAKPRAVPPTTKKKIKK